MKHLKQLFLALFLFASATASAHDFEVDGIFYNIISSSDFTVNVSYKGNSYDSHDNEYSGNVVIPDKVTYNGTSYSVTTIGIQAFYNCSGLISIEIPNSVTTIGIQAFYNCSGLTSVTIGNSVTSIDYFAFYDCNNLKTVYNLSSLSLYAGYTDYGYVAYYASKVFYAPNGSIEGDYIFGVFSGVNTLCGYIGNGGDIVLPADYKGENYKIGSLVFSGCTGLTSIEIPGSVTSIGYEAFSYCTGLTSVTIGHSVTTIGDHAFSNCNSLKSIVIPNSVTTIGYYAFGNCDGLTSVTIGNSVTSIGKSAFNGCTGLTSVTIPNSVTSIGDCAFENCNSLKSIVIPNSVTTIGYYAFRGCTGLTSVTIGNSVTTIGSSAFYGCNNLKTVYNLSSLSLSAGSYSYGYVAYYASKVIDAPNGSIEGDYIFGVFSGVNTLCEYIGNGGDIVLPADYKGENYKIGSSAFEDCTGLTSVTIPNSVASIGYAAFEGCTGLTSIEIPNSVASIGEYAFYYCDGLTDVYCLATAVPSADNAFPGESLANVTLHIPAEAVGNYSTTAPWSSFGTIETISFEVTAEINGLNYILDTATKTASVIAGSNIYSGDITIPAEVVYDNVVYSVTEIGGSAFSGSTGLTSIVVGDNVTTIGMGAFNSCKNLASITLGYGVNMVGVNAFSGCTGLTDIYSHNTTVPLASSRAFTNCNLANITLHVPAEAMENYSTTDPWNSFGAIKAISTEVTAEINYIFNTATKTATVVAGSKKYSGDITIPAEVVYDNVVYSVTSIGYAAFEYCPGLTSIEIPNSVASIGEFAFENCDALSNITIPNSVISIGNSAFLDCNGLISVTIGNGVTNIDGWAFCGCTGLTSITIPNSVTSIGNSAFSYCTGLTSIEIPSSVTNIGEYAFDGCSGLTEIYVKATTPPTIASDTFYNCSSATLYVPAGSKAAYLSADYWSEFTNIEEIIIPGDINGDIIVDVADVTMLVSAILNGEGAEETPTEQTFEDWTSTNAGVGGSTSQSSYTLEAAEGSVLTFDWSVSSESNYDWLTITLDGTQILKKSGSCSGSYEHTFTAAGTHTLVAKYTKDGSVNNGSDQGKIYNIKLSGSASSKNNSTADINGDGTVDVADVTRLISFILGTDTASAAATRAGEVSTVSADGDGETLLINITNPSYEFSAIQFDLDLPTGIEVAMDEEYYEVYLGSRAHRKHSDPECAVQADGSLRVVIMSLSNALFSGTEGDVATVLLKANGAADGEYPFTIKNVVISSTGKEVLAPYTGWITVSGGVTGIGEIIEERAESNEIYDLQGRKVTEPVKGGIYIQNGKKVMW